MRENTIIVQASPNTVPKNPNLLKSVFIAHLPTSTFRNVNALIPSGIAARRRRRGDRLGHDRRPVIRLISVSPSPSAVEVEPHGMGNKSYLTGIAVVSAVAIRMYMGMPIVTL
jgi:hypothetical protein